MTILIIVILLLIIITIMIMIIIMIIMIMTIAFNKIGYLPGLQCPMDCSDHHHHHQCHQSQFNIFIEKNVPGLQCPRDCCDSPAVFLRSQTPSPVTTNIIMKITAMTAMIIDDLQFNSSTFSTTNIIMKITAMMIIMTMTMMIMAMMIDDHDLQFRVWNTVHPSSLDSSMR